MITTSEKLSAPAGQSRAGVTVLEVISVLSVVTLLAALFFPAIQKAREAARRTTCASNLRQIGQAAYQHQSAHGTFPDPRFHLRELLPYLDQQALYEELISSEFGSETPQGNVSLLVCPSDSHSDSSRNDTNYWLNTGTWFATNRCNGMVVCESHIRRRAPRLQEVRDGLSNTAFYAERLVVPDVSWYSGPGTSKFAKYSRRYEKRFVWWPDRTFSPGDSAPLAQACQLKSTRVTAESPSRAGQRAFRASNGWYNHAGGPNSHSCYLQALSFWTPRHNHWGSIAGLSRGTVPSTSAHDGGVHVLLADGSNRFVSDQISLSTWRALGTRADRDEIGSF